MFERYTEQARRAVFFARFEAATTGSNYIETWHMLIGLLQADEALAERVIGRQSLDEFRKEFQQLRGPGKIPASQDLPVSQQLQRALAYAAEEAERTASVPITPLHLLAALLREDNDVKTVLAARGITLEACREPAVRAGVEPAHNPNALEIILSDLPPARIPAAIQIIEALYFPTVTVEVTTSHGRLVFRFPDDDASGAPEANR